MPTYEPPYQVTPGILKKVAAICEWIGRWSVLESERSTPRLRRENRIRTIHASLAIEHNTLTLDQVTAVVDGKRVLGLPREIQEVRNAFAAYEIIEEWVPHETEALLEAHSILMEGLVDRPGCFRSGGVGIYRGETLVHMAPPANRVSDLVSALMTWVASTDAHPLIASCVFHYEFEFIHPFDDGNGRLGRLWQTVILARWQPLMLYLPVEAVVHARQEAYYSALREADRLAQATPFVDFMLDALLAAMSELEPAKARKRNHATGSEKSSEESSEESSDKSSEKSSDEILSLLRQNPRLSARALAGQLGISPRAVEKRLASLRARGLLRRIGPSKGGYWETSDL